MHAICYDAPAGGSCEDSDAASSSARSRSGMQVSSRSDGTVTPVPPIAVCRVGKNSETVEG